MIVTSTLDEAKRVYALISGESGVGKTSLAKTLPHKRTLICSVENGLLALSDVDIPVVKIKGTKDFVSFIEEIKKGVDFDTIYIDSLTEILDMFLAELKEKYTKKQTFDMWDEYILVADYVLKALRDSKYNVFVTCLSKKEKDGLGMVDAFDFSGNKLQSRIKAYFDICIHYRIDTFESKSYRVLICDNEMSPLAKDRSGKLHKYEMPDLTALITKVLTKKEKV